MRHIFVGDVHGMVHELMALVEDLHLNKNDVLVFVGDLIDKGPDSVGVVNFVRKLSQTRLASVVLVEGNHEEKHRRFRRNLHARPDVAAEQAIKSPELISITEQLNSKDVEFLETAIPFYRIPEHNLLVVHGGIPGDMVEFPDTVEHVKELTGKAKKNFGKVLRTRFVDSETGKFLKLGDSSPEDPYWADIYDGRFGHVIFGHEPFMDEPGCFQHATGIDTGAVFGGSLTALVISDSGDRHFMSIPGQKFCEAKVI